MINIFSKKLKLCWHHFMYSDTPNKIIKPRKILTNNNDPPRNRNARNLGESPSGLRSDDTVYPTSKDKIKPWEEHIRTNEKRLTARRLHKRKVFGAFGAFHRPCHVNTLMKNNCWLCLSRQRKLCFRVIIEL
jgi:hypothetical protein